MREPAASLHPGLPPLPEELLALQDAARAEAAVVESGAEPRPAFLGLVTRAPRPLDTEERWARLQALLATCGRIQALLEGHRDRLRSFFTQLAAQLREVIGDKIGQVRELDAKRMRLLAVGRETHDRELQARSEELGLRLERFLRVLAQGTLLLLGKLEGCRRTLDAQAEDQLRQRGALERLALRVGALREVQAIERELGAAERAAGVAPELRFDEYRREYFAPLAELLEEVRAVDERLRAAAGEIAELASELEQARPGDAPFGARELAAVDSLLQGRALDAAAAEIDVALAVGDAPATGRALQSIESLVAGRLEDCFGEALARASREGTPQAWRAYLAQYPRAAGAQQAGEALQRLERESLAAARDATAQGAWRAVPAWRSLIERFPEGTAAREASLELARLRAEAFVQARRAASSREAFDAWHRLRSLFGDLTAEESREADEGYYGALVGLEPTPRHWRDYLAACPQGPLVAEAQAFLDAYAWVPEWAAAWGMDAHRNGRCWADLEVKAVRQRFRLIEPGVFVMGSPPEELGRKENEGPRHEVTLTKPFWIATTECTQPFWEAVTGTNPSRFQGRDRPVENVSWEDAVLFLRTLSGLAPGLEARLPTEAEWEYACRAGTTSAYAGSGLWQEMAWVPDNSGGETHPVATRPENAWGLHGMHGNVTEWVSDGLRVYGSESVVDPIGPPPTNTASARGGSFEWGLDGARSAYRTGAVQRALRGPGHGLRIAASASRDVTGWVRAAHIEADIDWLARPPDHGVFLGDLAPVRVGTAYAPAVNDAWGARSCLVGGRRCGTFVTVHAPTETDWAIPEHAFEFRAIGARADRPETFHGTWSYRILVDGKTLFESPPFYERRGGIPIVLPLPPGARRLTVVTETLGDHRYDWAILAWPYFRLKPPFERLARIPKGAIFLGDLEPTSAKVGHRELRGFKDAPGQAVPIGGKPCDTFLDIHAPAAVTYPIPEGANRFTAIGSRWDREFAAQGTWKYEVWIAGQRVFDSPALHQRPDGIPIDVAIPADARELTIRVDDFGDNYCDWSILAYPCFHFSESAEAVAARVGLQPGEVLFRTGAGGWLCAEPGGDGLRVGIDAAEPGARFRFHEVDGSACLFLLQAQDGRFVRLEGSRVTLATEADPKQHYLQLVHAGSDRFAIHHWGPYLSAPGWGVVNPTAPGVGLSESFQVVDPRYPPPAPPAALDLDRLRAEALVSLQFDASRVVEERGDRILIDARGGRCGVLHDGQIVPGRRAGAFALDGVRSALELRLKSPLPSAALSIAFWMRYESYDRNENRSFWLHQAEGGGDAMRLNQYYGRLAWDSGARTISRGEFLLGRWHHVAVVVEGLRHRLYVDGVAQVDGTGRFTPAGTPLWIGRKASGEPESFCHGLVEDVLVLQRALRPEEVRGLWRWS